MASGWKGNSKQRDLGERELTDILEQTLLLSGMFHRRHSVPGSSMSRDKVRKNQKLFTGSELQMGKMAPGGPSTVRAVFSPYIIPNT